MESYNLIYPLGMLLIANAMPVFAARLLGRHWDWPLDAGIVWRDGQRLLGSSKTWRGVFSAMLGCSLLAPLLGVEWWQGGLVALLAMTGDSVASFGKRRLGLPPSSKATGLDQIPEALLPLMYLQGLYRLTPLDILLLITAFFLLEKGLSILFFYLKIRKRPY